jgi:hypothetical protein
MLCAKQSRDPDKCVLAASTTEGRSCTMKRSFLCCAATTALTWLHDPPSCGDVNMHDLHHRYRREKGTHIHNQTIIETLPIVTSAHVHHFMSLPSCRRVCFHIFHRELSHQTPSAKARYPRSPNNGIIPQLTDSTPSTSKLVPAPCKNVNIFSSTPKRQIKPGPLSVRNITIFPHRLIQARRRLKPDPPKHVVKKSLSGPFSRSAREPAVYTAYPGLCSLQIRSVQAWRTMRVTKSWSWPVAAAIASKDASAESGTASGMLKRLSARSVAAWKGNCTGIQP